jgi:N-carbamoyl-L-amino-acid hydrolase
MTASPRIDLDRLLARLDEFNRIGALPGGGNCRLALSDDDCEPGRASYLR